MLSANKMPELLRPLLSYLLSASQVLDVSQLTLRAVRLGRVLERATICTPSCNARSSDAEYVKARHWHARTRQESNAKTMELNSAFYWVQPHEKPSLFNLCDFNNACLIRL